jgi:hypothetical protein
LSKKTPKGYARRVLTGRCPARSQQSDVARRRGYGTWRSGRIGLRVGEGGRLVGGVAAWCVARSDLGKGAEREGEAKIEDDGGRGVDW